VTNTFSTIYGKVSTPDWNDDLIVKSLRLYGEWAFIEQRLIASLIRQGDSLWDVGAFLGTFGIGAALESPEKPSKIVAVEPGSELYPHLLENLRHNAPCIFEIAPFAVASETGWLRPRSGTGSGNAGAVSYEVAQDGQHGIAARVESRSLKDLRASFGNYDVLKLDVEGMENAAVRGDLEYIKQNRPVIWAECNENSSSLFLLEALCWLGYDPLYVAFPAFRKANFNGSTEVIYPMAYEAVLLAAPADRLSKFNREIEGEDVIVRDVRTSFDLRKALWSTPRWSMLEWAGLSRPELIALLGHQERGESLEGFMV